MKKHTRRVAIALIGIMAISMAPFAHAGSGHEHGSSGESTVAEQSTHQAHDAASMAMSEHVSHQPATPSSDTRSVCCEGLGLCSTAVMAISDSPSDVLTLAVLAASIQPRNLPGLYEPGLDLPPPRHS